MEESPDCSHDSLTIYDGDSDESPVLGTYCGTEAPSFVASTGSNATAVFRTDSNNTSTGYKFYIEFTEGISSSFRFFISSVLQQIKIMHVLIINSRSAWPTEIWMPV